MTNTPRADAPADFSFANHGSVVLLTPETDAAQDWCGEHLPEDALRHGRAFAIEPRYAQPVLDGIEDADLTITA